MIKVNLSEEFDRQVKNLIDKNYHKEIGKSEGEFKKLLNLLKEKLTEVNNTEFDPENGYLPFVIVVKSSLIPSEIAMELTNWNEKTGITKLFPLKPIDFNTNDSVHIPDEDIYLLIGINRGGEYLNMRPQDAISDIQKKGLLPVTIDEGIAIITHFPQFLKRNHCFSLLASRKRDDKRVPAIWINSKNEANLGWCWEGNPHTWLGSAYALKRI